MRILTRNIAIREEQNWLETLKNAISDPKILLKTLKLPVEDFAEDIVARKLFAMRVPLPFVEKMEKEDARTKKIGDDMMPNEIKKKLEGMVNAE